MKKIDADLLERRIMTTYFDGETKARILEIIDSLVKDPELRESEEERIRKAIFKALSKKDARDVLLAEGIQVSDALSWLEKQKDIEERWLKDREGCFWDGVAEGREQKEQKSKEDIIGKAMSYFGAESLLDNANGLSDFEKFTAWLYCEFLCGLPKKLNQEYIKEQTKVILDAAQKELCKMPDSTKLLEMWDAEKDMLQEKDFRGDTWRIAQNAFMDGFARGTCVKFEKQKEQSMSATEVLARAGLKPYKDGNQWCILAGDNIQDGICGFGDTIDEALYEFLKEVLIMANSPQLKEQKPAEWSEEDSDILRDAICAADILAKDFKRDNPHLSKTLRVAKEWLESLPERFTLAIKQEWDEFDEDCLKRAIWYVENPAPAVVKDTNLALWLKSLPGRFNLQPKQEWSEEDEKMSISILNLLCSQITYVSGSGTTTGKQFPTYANERDWFEKRFKSLRLSWKPSEEQLEALDKAIRNPNMGVTDKMLLDDLLKILKKLM